MSLLTTGVLEGDISIGVNNTFNTNPTFITLEGVQNGTDVNFKKINTSFNNVTEQFHAETYLTSGSGLSFNFYDDGSDIFMNVTNGGGNFAIEQDNSKLILFNEPNEANDLKVLQVFSKEATDITEFVVTKAGLHFASFFVRSLCIGITQANCSMFTKFVDLDTDVTGADMFIAHELEVNQTIYSKIVNITERYTFTNDKVNISSSGDVNATKFYGDGSALTGIIGLNGLWKLLNFTEAFNNVYNLSLVIENGTDASLKTINTTNLIVTNDINVSENVFIAGKLGIGVTDTVESFEVNSSSSLSAKFHAKGTFTNVMLDIVQLIVRVQTGSQSLDGFGASWTMLIQDIDGIKQIAEIGAIRQGADNEGALRFLAGTNGAEEFMRINSNGSVGINVIDSTHRLNVNNKVNMSDVGDVNATSFYGSNGYFGNEVGIGTENPISTLHIETISPNILLNATSTDVGDPKLLFRNENTGDGANIFFDTGTRDLFIQNLADDANGDIVYITRQSGTPIESMRVKGTGEVGIMINPPSTTFHTVGTEHTIETGSSGSNNFANRVNSLVFVREDLAFDIVTNKITNSWAGGGSADSTMNFELPSGTLTHINVMTLNALGNVGIGTPTPNANLHVNGSVCVYAGTCPTATAGHITIQKNLTLWSQDLTQFNCGVSNTGTFICT